MNKSGRSFLSTLQTAAFMYLRTFSFELSFYLTLYNRPVKSPYIVHFDS